MRKNLPRRFKPRKTARKPARKSTQSRDVFSGPQNIGGSLDITSSSKGNSTLGMDKSLAPNMDEKSLSRSSFDMGGGSTPKRKVTRKKKKTGGSLTSKIRKKGGITRKAKKRISSKGGGDFNPFGIKPVL